MLIEEEKELNTKIGSFDVFVTEERLTRSLVDDLTCFKHISSIRDQEGLLHILLYDEDRCPFRIDLSNRIEYLFDQKGGKP